MQDDNHQDFFEFEDDFQKVLEGRHPLRRRQPRRGGLFVILGICAAIVAALATVFGIFRSDNSTLRKDLRRTFSIQSPPPASRPVVQPPKSRSVEKIAEIEPARGKTAAEPTSAAASKTGETAPLAANDGLGEKASALQDEQASRLPPVTAPKEALRKSVNPDVPTGLQKKNPASAPAERTARLAPQPPTRIKPSEKESGLPDLRSAIRQGRLPHAALVYRQYFSRHPAKYSISLEVACRVNTVIRAFTEVDPAGEMFILPTRIGDRSCFAVLWGSYRTLQEARAGKTSVPSFFTSQTSPRIVALSRYMVPD